MATITVITLTLNEERNIADCLASARWADELIVVDSGSSDGTLEIARRFTGAIHTVAWTGYGAARNFALDRAHGDWVFWLDADERMTEDLAAEIRAVVDSPSPAAGYQVARRAYFLGRWIRHCGWYPSRVTRLFRREQGRFSETRVHEHLVMHGPVGTLHNDLLHYTDPDLRHYLSKFNSYTSLAAADLQAAGRRCTLFDLLIRPPFLFLKMYLFRFGFLDGYHGLILSVLSACYVFTKYAKLWELEKH